jgi:soluble lytic murein transglycosylase-like protein
MKTGYGIQDTGFRKGGAVRSDTVLPRSSLHPVSRILYPVLLALCIPLSAQAGAQKEEKLSASVRSMMQQAVADQAAPKLAFSSQQEAQLWLDDMSQRLAKRIPDANYRFDLLSTVHYEATRAGLDPHLVLGLIEVESGFRKYAVSKSGARGYMQVMPFWTKTIGSSKQDLFHLRTNLRYGCTILRYYLDQEHGDLYRALGRYNGSLGKPEYPNMVKAAWHNHWTKPQSLGKLRTS